MRILYYVHHHGLGHIHRAKKLVKLLPEEAELHLLYCYDHIKEQLEDIFFQTHKLPTKWSDTDEQNRCTNEGFTNIPANDKALQRGRIFTNILSDYEIDVFLSDHSLELTIQASLLGVKTVMSYQHGEYEINTYEYFAYKCADLLYAPFPDLGEAPREFARKMLYLGFLADRDMNTGEINDHVISVVLNDSDESKSILKKLSCIEDKKFEVFGVNKTLREENHRNIIFRGFVPKLAQSMQGTHVICRGGNNTLGEMLLAGKKILAFPEEKPFREQYVKCRLLKKAGYIETSFLNESHDLINQKIESLTYLKSFEPSEIDLQIFSNKVREIC